MEFRQETLRGLLSISFQFNGHLPCYKTFERFLKAANFKIVKLQKKPFISRKNMEERIEFAKKYVKKPVGFWKKIIWSDEIVVRSHQKESMFLFRRIHANGVKKWAKTIKTMLL